MPLKRIRLHLFWLLVVGMPAAGLALLFRQAIDDQVDLMVVEKFGEKEQEGKGLIDEIMQTIVEGIPLLISVPEAALPIWQERSGELGSVLGFSEAVFEGWWRGLR